MPVNVLPEQSMGLGPCAHATELTADQRQLIGGTTGFSPSYLLGCWLLGLTRLTRTHKAPHGIYEPAFAG